MADGIRGSSSSEIPEIVLQASEVPGGAPVVYTDGIHARMRNGNVVKISLFQDLPAIRPEVVGEDVGVYPRRQVVAHLIIEALVFADIVDKMNDILQDLIKDGTLAIARDGTDEAAS